MGLISGVSSRTYGNKMAPHKSFPGATLKHEPEVDVDNVALLVDHYVAIVSVFNLEDESQDAVGSHTSDEVSSCILIGSGCLVTILLDEIGVKVSVCFPAKLVPGLGIRDTFDDTTAWLGCDDF